MSSFRFTFLAALLILTSGCYLRPNFGPPGTIGMQRSRAVLHDPFPSNELGPPILGGRPLGFDLPQSQSENLQEVRSSLFSNQANTATTFNGGPITTNGQTFTPNTTIPQFIPVPQ